MAWHGAWDRVASWSRQLLAAAVGTRPVPRHLAFIMDGNRRFAEQRQLRRIEGHHFGYAKLIDALEWCLELGVECVSVYAFSIDNYKRSYQEVELLMDLAEQKLATMLQEMAVLQRRGVQVRVLGDLSLAPQRVQQAAAQVMEATRHHTRAVLNICFSYTASQELLQALDRAGVGVASGSDSSMFLDAQMYTQGCPPVDLLIRTSGETRLSDFLLWQSRRALLVFTAVLWPDFGFLDLLAAVLEYQQKKPALERLRLAEAAGLRAAAAATEARGQQQRRRQRLQQQQARLRVGSPFQEGRQRQGEQQAEERQQEGQQQQQQLGGEERAGHPCPSFPGGQQLPGDSPTAAGAAAVADADALCMLGVLSPRLGGSSSTFTPLGSDSVAVVKAFELGGDSPRAIASPDSPSSPSVHSGDGEAGAQCPLLPLPPRWEQRLRSPSAGSMHSLLGLASPQPPSGSEGCGNANGDASGIVNGNGLYKYRSPSSSHRLGSVDSFSSIDLYGDGSGALPRQRLSYQDLGGLEVASPPPLG